VPGLGGSAGFTPDNHVSRGAIPAAVRRVAVLPLHAAQSRATEVSGLEDAFRGELAGMERFEITPISRAEMTARFGRESFASSAALPEDFLARLRADFGVDGVLFLDLTQYRPYQPVAVGVRAKLVVAGDPVALWSFDSLFDSSRPEVANAARQFSSGSKRPGGADEDSTGVLQSPGRFAKYVGHAMFATLPPRRTE
jgi:hypothetical protein